MLYSIHLDFETELSSTATTVSTATLNSHTLGKADVQTINIHTNLTQYIQQVHKYGEPTRIWLQLE